MSAHIWDVLLAQPGEGDMWDYAGQVILPYSPAAWQMENALRVFGIYAPRGNDCVLQHDELGSVNVYDSWGEPLVRLHRIETTSRGARRPQPMEATDP